MARKFFPDLPIPEGFQMTKIEDWGEGNYVTTLDGISKKDYHAYLAELKEIGYEKYVDNGTGLGGTVFTSTFTKER